MCAREEEEEEEQNAYAAGKFVIFGSCRNKTFIIPQSVSQCPTIVEPTPKIESRVHTPSSHLSAGSSVQFA